ncbi:MAG: molybdenum cofactor guanylyltransferase [Deferribacterota bacterium]|nr:molybdenum cofactor guanylyltransferase [Deferribacterota bacterium]
MSHNISVAILAGGKSERFGRDKTLTMLNNKPLIKYVVDAFSEVDDIVIIAKNIKKYNILNTTKVVDKYESQCPLVGIITALEYTVNDLVYIVSADMPFVNMEIFKILNRYLEKDVDILLPKINGKIYTLAGIYRKRAKKVLEENFKSGKNKILDAFGNLKVNTLDERYFRDVDPQFISFLNINKKEDFIHAEKLVKKVFL